MPADKSIEINGWKLWHHGDQLLRAPLDNPSEISVVGPDADPQAVAKIKEQLREIESRPAYEYDVCLDGGFINDESFTDGAAALAVAEKLKSKDTDAIVTVLITELSE